MTINEAGEATSMIPTAEQYIESVIEEGVLAKRQGSAEHSNFLPPAIRTMRRAERMHGEKCVPILIERLLTSSVDNPSAKLLIGSLIRLVPTRQDLYEQALDEALPSWRTLIEGNPQFPLPQEFHDISVAVRQQPLEFPQYFLDALIKSSESKNQDVVIAALRAFQKVGAPELLGQSLNLSSSVDAAIRSEAILTSARLSALDAELNHKMASLVQDRSRPVRERLAAFDAVILSHVHSGRDYLAEFAAESNGVLEDSEAIFNAALDSARPNLALQLQRVISDRSFDAISDETLRRIARFPGFSQKLVKEITGRMKLSALNEQMARRGLLIHRNSSITAAFIGHTGIFVDEETVVHCTVGFDPHAVRSDSLSVWKDGQECWGIREDDQHPQMDRNLAANKALEILSWRTEYDGTHNNQKGKWFKGWFCAPKYWEADCVGFTEHCYEEAGGNPTPNEYESGLGAPLTPREQRDHMRKVFDC